MTLWDAEVVLAHALEADGVMSGSLLELGCGSGLAAMVSFRLGCCVTVQDLPDVLSYTTEVFKNNNVTAKFVGARWGSELYETELKDSAFDYIVMADVLYHCSDFDDLISSIVLCSKPFTQVYICYEQRRRNLEEFFGTLEKHSFIRLPTSGQCTVINKSNGIKTDIHLLKYEYTYSAEKK